MKQISVLGVTPSSLATAMLAVHYPFEICIYSTDALLVDSIANGRSPIVCGDYQTQFERARSTGRFIAQTSLEPADYFIVADQLYEQGVSTLLMALACVLKKGDTIIIESPLTLGAMAQTAQFLEKKTRLKAGVDFFLAYCPEQLPHGLFIEDFTHTKRLIGGISQSSNAQVINLYKQWIKADMYTTDAETAEFATLVLHSYRHMQHAYAIPLAEAATRLGVNPYEVAQLTLSDEFFRAFKAAWQLPDERYLYATEALSSLSDWYGTFFEPIKGCAAQMVTNIYHEIAQAIEQWTRVYGVACTVALIGKAPRAYEYGMGILFPVIEKLMGHANINLIVNSELICQDAPRKAPLKIASYHDAVAQAGVVVFMVNDGSLVVDEQQLRGKVVVDRAGVLYRPHTNNSVKNELFCSGNIENEFTQLPEIVFQTESEIVK